MSKREPHPILDFCGATTFATWTMRLVIMGLGLAMRQATRLATALVLTAMAGLVRLATGMLNLFRQTRRPPARR